MHRGGNGGQKDFQKTEGKVLDSCVVPASTYGLETLALSELHQHRLQVCENNWIRRIARVKRVERRRMKDLREEVGAKACIVGKIVKSRMKWAGHMVRMKAERSPKKSQTKKQEGFRKRGRPHLIWEDCVKRNLRKAEEEEKWREKANNRDQWKQITKVAVPWSDQKTSLIPTQGNQRKNNGILVSAGRSARRSDDAVRCGRFQCAHRCG